MVWVERRARRRQPGKKQRLDKEGATEGQESKSVRRKARRQQKGDTGRCPLRADAQATGEALPTWPEVGWEERRGEDNQFQAENLRRQGPWGPAWSSSLTARDEGSDNSRKEWGGGLEGRLCDPKAVQFFGMKMALPGVLLTPLPHSGAPWPPASAASAALPPGAPALGPLLPIGPLRPGCH